MSYSLNSLKGGLYRGLYRGSTIGLIKRDTRSLDYSSYGDDGKENGNYYFGFYGLGFRV